MLGTASSTYLGARNLDHSEVRQLLTRVPVKTFPLGFLKLTCFSLLLAPTAAPIASLLRPVVPRDTAALGEPLLALGDDILFMCIWQVRNGYHQRGSL